MKETDPDFQPSCSGIRNPLTTECLALCRSYGSWSRFFILLLCFCIDSRSSFCRCLRVAHTQTLHGFCTHVVVSYSSAAGVCCFVVVHGCRCFMNYTKSTLGNGVNNHLYTCNRDLRSFEIRFNFESNYRFGI